MSDAHLAAIGAFLSGAGSVLSAWLFVRSQRRRAEQECEKRIQLLREGFKMGRQ